MIEARASSAWLPVGAQAEVLPELIAGERQVLALVLEDLREGPVGAWVVRLHGDYVLELALGVLAVPDGGVERPEQVADARVVRVARA